MQAEPSASAQTPGSPASRTQWEVSFTSVSEIRSRRAWQRNDTVPLPAHLDRSDKQPARGCDAPVIELLNADGHDVRVDRPGLRPDDRAVASASASPTPRSATIAVTGSLPRVPTGLALSGARALPRGDARVNGGRFGPGPRPCIHDVTVRPRSCGAEHHDVRLRVGPRCRHKKSTPPGARWWCPPRSRRSVGSLWAQGGRYAPMRG